MPYRPSPTLKRYAPLLRRLVRLTTETSKALRELRKPPLIPDQILLAFLAKAADTLRAVVILQKHGLCHEAQALARVLFELRLSFDAFADMLIDDPRKASLRVWDTVMLEKIKQARASEFKGFEPGAPTPKDFNQHEKEIATRYSGEELARLKRYGFSGMSVERRAARSGLSDEYNICYRNFSRNVHSTDFTELFLQENPRMISTARRAHLESRDRVCCQIAFISAGGITHGVSGITGLGLQPRFRELERAWIEADRASER
jgi:hypothetical protein